MLEMESRAFVYPIDPESRNDILSIDRRTKEDVRVLYRFYMNSDWECNTITNMLVEAMLKVLYSHIQNHGVSILTDEDDNTLNFYDLMELTASNKKNDNAEKTGNINIKFSPGKEVDFIINDNGDDGDVEPIDPGAAFVYPEDDQRTGAMKKLDSIARQMLKEKYGIILPKDWQSIAVGATFLTNIYKHLIAKLVASDKKSVMINFNDLIEFHAQKEGDGAKVFLRPGMGAKLIIKSDESTEADDDDSDDEYA